MSRFYIICLCVSLLFVFSGCVNDDGYEIEPELNGGSLRKTVLYYQTNDGYIIPVMRQIPWEEGIAAFALSYLVSSPENDEETLKCGLKTVIPEGTKFSLKIDDEKNAILDVQNMPDLKDTDAEQVFLQSVVNTLTEFDSIDTVSMTFDGERVAKLHGGTPVNEKMRSFMLNPMNLDTETMANGDINTVSLYVPDSTCVYNLPITAYSNKEADFRTAMDMFCDISCEQNNGLPYGTEIISAQISDGTASVNFSEDFARLYLTGDGILNAMYNAIYLTACEYGSVTELKLYAGAEAVDCSSFSVSAPLYVNEWYNA